MISWDVAGGPSFFFQAEDGIRYLTVTGVQTCALPISSVRGRDRVVGGRELAAPQVHVAREREADRKSTRLNSSHSQISYAVFCLKKKKNNPVTRAVKF